MTRSLLDVLRLLLLELLLPLEHRVQHLDLGLRQVLQGGGRRGQRLEGQGGGGREGERGRGRGPAAPGEGRARPPLHQDPRPPARSPPPGLETKAEIGLYVQFQRTRDGSKSWVTSATVEGRI